MTILNASLLALLWLFTLQWEATIDGLVDGTKEFARLRRDILVEPAAAIAQLCQKPATTSRGMLDCVTKLYWWRADLKTAICDEFGDSVETKVATAIRRRYQITWRCQMTWPARAKDESSNTPLLKVALPELTATLIR